MPFERGHFASRLGEGAMFRYRLSLMSVVLIAALMLGGGSAFARDIGSANFMMPGCRIFALNATGTFQSG
jgi:hypothetical protein